MLLTLDITVTQSAAPMLAKLLREIEDDEKPRLMRWLADDFEILTREHITRAAASRHKTAAKLGATPTRYLETRAQSVESSTEGTDVILRMQGDIFKRAAGPVTVTAKQAKMLTIPWRKEAYGKRAGEFADLFPVRSKRGNAFLARRNGRTVEFLFLLKKSVTLPQDRGLLPSSSDYAKRAERVAKRFVNDMVKRLSQGAA
jgi:hypothetical protein